MIHRCWEIPVEISLLAIEPVTRHPLFSEIYNKSRFGSKLIVLWALGQVLAEMAALEEMRGRSDQCSGANNPAAAAFLDRISEMHYLVRTRRLHACCRQARVSDYL